MDDLYLTIARETQVELKVKSSRFIGEIFSTSSIDQAKEQLARVRKREHAATHHCYAYRVGLFDETEFKYSDDGEPSGTAGRPIYDAICGRDITNAILIVTRYFGGTKLGTGGLVRAYGDAAGMALDQAGQKENYVMSAIKVEIDFAQYDQLARLCSRLEARQTESDFSDIVRLTLEIRKSRAEELIGSITELTNGRAKITEAK